MVAFLLASVLPAAAASARSARSAPAAAVPEGLRAAVIATTQAAAGPDYGVRAAGADNPAQQLRVAARADGLQLTGTAARFQTGLTLRRYGCGSALRPARAATPRLSGNRIEYVRPGLSEWYVNGPLGVEQGFTLAARPACRPAAADGQPALRIELAFDTALSPALVDGDRPRIELRDAAGRAALSYSDLYAYDADGRSLPARLRLDGRTVSLEVDDRAARYPVTVDPLMWTQQARIVAGDAAFSDDFGFAVALSGDTALVGAPVGNGTLSDTGAAYVYTRTGSTWTQQTKLTLSTAAFGDSFGYSVALEGDTAVIGAPGRDVGVSTDAGSAYVYTRSGTQWTLQATLAPVDLAGGDAFGRSVALSGDTAVIGAPLANPSALTDAGAAYVFTRSGATWTQQQKLAPTTPVANDQFATAVAVFGDAALIGAPRRDGATANSDVGSAVFYVRSGTTWTQQAEVIPTDAVAADMIGSAVALSSDTAVIGAPLVRISGLAGAGAAYVYSRVGNSLTFQTKLQAPVPSSSDSFGSSVAIVTDTIVVGAPRRDGFYTDSGAAYAYSRVGTVWSLQGQLLASDGLTSDQLGTAVAVSGDTALVGARSGNGSRGAAYAFFRAKANGDACTQPSECIGGSCIAGTCRSGKTFGQSCFSGSECASGFCTDGVCCNTACGSGATDCQACSVTAGGPTDGTCSPVPAGRVCNSAKSECDEAELCDGTSLQCPTDRQKPEGAQCAYGTCQAGRCTPDAPLVVVPEKPGSMATGCSLSHPSPGPASGSGSPAHAQIAAALGVLAASLLLRRTRRSSP